MTINYVPIDSNTSVINLPPGIYERIEIPDGIKGLIIRGSGRAGDNATIIKGMTARGLWYSHFSNILFKPLTAENILVDIDKGSFGTQGNTFDNCSFEGQGMNDGKLSDYCFAMNHISSNSGQGSENTFINCHFSGARKACVYIQGMNALNNQFIGGNFQFYERCGIEAVFGSFHVFGTGFQSTFGVKQIENGGWDIKADSGGVGDSLTITGCRTESLRFMIGCGAQPPMITNCNQRITHLLWWPHYNYRENDLIIVGRQVYRCTIDHQSGTNPEELYDIALWSPLTFNVVELLTGVMFNNNWQCGNVVCYHNLLDPVAQISHDGASQSPLIYNMEPNIDHIVVDAAKGPVTINLCSAGIVSHGKEVKVIRGDHSKHQVLIKDTWFNNKTLHALSLTPGKVCMTFKAVGGGTIPRRWYWIDTPFVD